LYILIFRFLIWDGKTKDFGMNNSKHSLNLIYSWLIIIIIIIIIMTTTESTDLVLHRTVLFVPCVTSAVQ
jgi:hypothetical protein